VAEVTAASRVRTTEDELLAAACSGDEAAFALLIEPYERVLHLHCYRMLGSLHDADDASQETLLRAWRHLGSYQPRSTLSAWLHAIATNVCLTMLRRRTRLPLPVAGPGAWEAGLMHLQPYPDRLLDELEESAPGPDARYEQRESVQLALITALQLLPPKQRAVLILRDVLGWSAKETAETLDDTVAAVNSALQRARSRLERAERLGARSHAPTTSERDLLRRFMAAWDAVDVDGLVALLARDVHMTMPPEPTYEIGEEALRRFFRTVPAEGRLDEIRLVPTAANRQPALAAYLLEPDGVYRAYGVMVFSIERGAITGIVGLPDTSLFEHFGLSPELDVTVSRRRSG
jgi:RNA polymerase sigma-70 factor, ECF subfamily